MPPVSPKQAPGGRRSRTTLYVVVGAALAIAAAVAVAALFLRDGGSSAASSTPVVDLEGIPQEGMFLGAAGAKVTLVEYADVQCPACRHYTETLFPTLVDEYVRPGKVRNEFRGYPFLGEDSLKGQQFLMAAAEQDKLWQLQEAFYRNQGAENSGWLTDELIHDVASQIPGLDVDKLFADAQADGMAEAAQQQAATSQEELLEFTDQPYTPSLVVKVGDEKPYLIQVATPDQLREALDAALQ